MIDNIFSEERKTWNKNLKAFVEKEGSQASFAKKLNEKYRTDEDKQFRQPTISNWWNVGANREGKAPIGFPKFENMLMIADCLGVDIGYLIGETNAETFDLAKASEFMRLDPNALKNFLKVMDGDGLSQEYGINKYGVVLNKLLCSKYLDDFIESLNALEDTYVKYRNMVPNLPKLNETDLAEAHLDSSMAKLSDKYGEAIFNQACDAIRVDEYPFSLTNEERDAEKEISNISFGWQDALIRSKSNWHTIVEKSLAMQKEMDYFSNRHGEGLLKKIWSYDNEHLNLTEEQMEAAKHLYIARNRFNLFLNNTFLLKMDLLIYLLNDIKRISDKYPDDVLEKAWEHYKLGEAIKDVQKAIDENDGFLYTLKREISYHRFLVQESLILLLNDIFPTSVDLRNNLL